MVTKLNADNLKITPQQEKEKVINNVNPSATQEVKMNSEIQCDKETSSAKISTPIDTSAPLSASYNTTGYDSDSSKPVKVKSRWRRSSELEMGGSSAGFVSVIAPMTSIASSELENCAPMITAESTSLESKDNINSTNIKSETEQDASVTSNNCSLVEIPKTIGAKIPLPMVLEAENREMEERLSQFEHLRENLYLTER